jgi:hypothetical protein
VKIRSLNYRLLVAAIFLIATTSALMAQSSTYLGFDRNEYPGSASLPVLRQSFSYAGYWLNNPPGESSNSWAGHRAAVQNAGFGFLVLFNGRLYAELKSVANAQRLGRADANKAVAAAKREGFPAATIIFLDQEQGGRMLPEQKAYIFFFIDAVTSAGFRAGIYCSAIPSPDGQHVITAEDIRKEAGSRQITYWAINDACPPAPGCTYSQHPPTPSQSGIALAEVWQFAQSPQRKDVAGRCANYAHDGNCYPPGTTAAQGLHVDLNSATSADPSHGRTK